MKPKQRRHQHGFIFIFLMVMMATAAIAALTVNVWGNGNSAAYDRKLTRQALQQAKEALLASVEIGGTTGFNSLLDKASINLPVNSQISTTGLGQLPCTDSDGDGEATAGCGTAIAGIGAGVHSLGLFPWKTIEMPRPKDSANECLWYAVSGDHKSNNRPATINADTSAPFSIIQPVKNINPTTGAVTWTERLLAGNTSAGVLPASANRVVAVIIAPGTASSSQNRTPLASSRTCPLPLSAAGVPNAETSAARYLETYTGTSLSGNNRAIAAPSNVPKIFVQADENHEKLNDELIWITAEEFSNAASKRALRAMANAIDRYVYGGFDDSTGVNAYIAGNGRYPPAASKPGGACVPNRVQGYVPLTCALPGTTALNMGGTTGQLSTDQWRIHAHYAVSENCFVRTTALGAISTPPFTAQNVPTNVCTAGPRVQLGSDTSSVHALILMRGMAKNNQGCLLVADALSPAPAVPTPVDMHLCIEDPINANIVLAGNAVAATASVVGITYQPIKSGSNDLMYTFRQRTK